MTSPPARRRMRQRRQLESFVDQLLSSDPLAPNAALHFQRLQQQYPLDERQRKLWQRQIEQRTIRAQRYQREQQYQRASDEWRAALQLCPIDPELQQHLAEVLWHIFCYQGYQSEYRQQAIQLNHQALLTAEGELLLQAQKLAQDMARWRRKPPRRLWLALFIPFGLAAAALALVVLGKQLSSPPARITQRSSTPSHDQVPLEWLGNGSNSNFFLHSSRQLSSDHGPLYSLRGRLLWQGPPIQQARLHLNLYRDARVIKQDFDPLLPKQAPLLTGDSLPIDYLVRLGSGSLKRVSLQPGLVTALQSNAGSPTVLSSSGALTLSLQQVRKLQAGERPVYYYDVQVKNQGSSPVEQLKLQLLWPGNPEFRRVFSLLDPQKVSLDPSAAYNYRLVLQPPIERTLEPQQMQVSLLN